MQVVDCDCDDDIDACIDGVVGNCNSGMFRCYDTCWVCDGVGINDRKIHSFALLCFYSLTNWWCSRSFSVPFLLHFWTHLPLLCPSVQEIQNHLTITFCQCISKFQVIRKKPTTTKLLIKTIYFFTNLNFINY